MLAFNASTRFFSFLTLLSAKQCSPILSQGNLRTLLNGGEKRKDITVKF